MGAFAEASDVSVRSIAILEPEIIKHRFTEYEFISDMDFQLHSGDLIGQCAETGKTLRVELKAEDDDKWGNFFLEEYSNRRTGRKGWMYQLLYTDILMYHFVNDNRLYIFDFKELKTWYRHNKERFPFEQQSKYQQANDSWGYCVPINALLYGLNHVETKKPAKSS